MKTLQGEKFLWLLPTLDQDNLLLNFAAHYNVSYSIIRALISRGLNSKEKIDQHLFCSREHNVFHASLLKDAQKSVERIMYAIKKKEKILIFGDYDVDGITASAMMIACLLPLGAHVNFFLPHRTRDGYGISVESIQKAAKNNYTLIITVDNGITAFDAAKEAKRCGIDLIITDHHCPHDKIPEAYTIVNPTQVDCKYPFKFLAGVGVAFKLLSLLYEYMKRQLPDKAYELLLLGTIADVVPLIGENRFWVRYCLNYLNKKQSLSLSILKRNSNIIKPLISSTDIGFSIVPQINALGRLTDPRRGVNFLISSQKNEVEKLGSLLWELNQERKTLERSIFDEIEQDIQQKKIDLDKENVIVSVSDSWPPGVVGLVASRLASAYGKPAVVLHIHDGIAKGSCRSIPGFNIFNALQKSSDLLLRFGGHAYAAGLTLEQAKIDELKGRLETLIAQELTPFDLQPKINLDAEVTLSELTKKFIMDMEYLEPFGNENEQPSFYIKKVSLVQKPLLLKDLHVKCHIFADGIIKPIIFFNRPELFQKLMNQESGLFDIAARVVENYWNGRTNIELLGLDIAKCEE